MKTKKLPGKPDENAQKRMIELGMKFALETFPIAEIDWLETDKNYVRIGRPYIPDAVEDYSIAQLDGAVFNYGVATKTHPKVLLGGRHRTRAAEKGGFTHVTMYVVDGTEAELEFLSFCLNRDEGNRADRDQAIEFAMYRIRRYGDKPKEVAKLLHVKVHLINKRLRFERLKKLGAEAGAKDATGIPQTAMLHLGTLGGNTKVFAAACDLVFDTKMTSDEALELTTAVREKKTEAQQLAVIEEQATIRKRAFNKKPKFRGSKQTEFFRHFSGILRCCKCDLTWEILNVRPDSEEAARVEKSWPEIRRKINRLLKK